MLVVRASRVQKFTLQTRKAQHWVVKWWLYERCVSKNLLYKHGKPNTGWSNGGCTSVACPKIYFTNTESPTLGGQMVVVQASRVQKFTLQQTRKAPHWVVKWWLYERPVSKNLLYKHGKSQQVVSRVVNEQLHNVLHYGQQRRHH